MIEQRPASSRAASLQSQRGAGVPGREMVWKFVLMAVMLTLILHCLSVPVGMRQERETLHRILARAVAATLFATGTERRFDAGSLIQLTATIAIAHRGGQGNPRTPSVRANPGSCRGRPEAGENATLTDARRLVHYRPRRAVASFRQSVMRLCLRRRYGIGMSPRIAYKPGIWYCQPAHQSQQDSLVSAIKKWD